MRAILCVVALVAGCGPRSYRQATHWTNVNGRYVVEAKGNASNSLGQLTTYIERAAVEICQGRAYKLTPAGQSTSTSYTQIGTTYMPVDKHEVVATVECMSTDDD